MLLKQHTKTQGLAALSRVEMLQRLRCCILQPLVVDCCTFVAGCSYLSELQHTSGAIVLLFHIIFIRSLLLSLRIRLLYSCVACQVIASSRSRPALSAKPSLLSIGLSVPGGQPSRGGHSCILLLPLLQKCPAWQSSMAVVFGQ